MTPADYSETEVKLYVPDLLGLAARLEQVGAELTAPRVYERNVRYENAARTLADARIVLRLREDTRVRLTYKEPPAQIRDADIPNRYEAEVEVSDFVTMQVILGKLGYFPHQVYEKYRTTYELETDAGRVEVVLDEMPYGNFAEIEGTPDAIRAARTRLDLDSAPMYRANYLNLFANVRQHLGLSFNDLTFDNFQGITVPVSAFAEVS